MDAKFERNNYNGPIGRAMEKILKFIPTYNLRENWHKMFYRQFVILSVIANIDKAESHNVGNAIIQQIVLSHETVMQKNTKKHWKVMHEKIVKNQMFLLSIILKNIHKIIQQDVF